MKKKWKKKIGYGNLFCSVIAFRHTRIKGWLDNTTSGDWIISNWYSKRLKECKPIISYAFFNSQLMIQEIYTTFYLRIVLRLQEIINTASSSLDSQYNWFEAATRRQLSEKQWEFVRCRSREWIVIKEGEAVCKAAAYCRRRRKVIRLTMNTISYIHQLLVYARPPARSLAACPTHLRVFHLLAGSLDIRRGQRLCSSSSLVKSSPHAVSRFSLKHAVGVCICEQTPYETWDTQLLYMLNYKWQALIKLSRSSLVVCISNWS